MYVSPNFKSKKALKEAVAASADETKTLSELRSQGCSPMTIGAVLASKIHPRYRIRVFSPGPFPCPTSGIVAVEGPHYPQPHRWYARVEVKDGYVVKVLS